MSAAIQTLRVRLNERHGVDLTAEECSALLEPPVITEMDRILAIQALEKIAASAFDAHARAEHILLVLKSEPMSQ